tara:strand:+ start:7574 stop:8044 length:471 start_codon:yes stop_codon:yes gene_type:complete
MFSDIAHLREEYFARLSSSSTLLTARRKSLKMAELHSGKHSLDLLLSTQIRELFFYLGFEGSKQSEVDNLDPEIENPSIDKVLPVSASDFRIKIVETIPESAHVEITQNNTNGSRTYKNTAYEESGVEQAVQSLNQNTKLDYTPDRFQYALALVKK